VNAEFNWWLLIVGLVLGAGLVWLVLADSRRREVDVTERERESEALWIAEAMERAGRPVTDADALDVLRLHEAYLAASPPDEVEDPAETRPDADRWDRPGDGVVAEPARARMAHPLDEGGDG
jgi:hypothetical protein